MSVFTDSVQFPKNDRTDHLGADAETVSIPKRDMLQLCALCRWKTAILSHHGETFRFIVKAPSGEFDPALLRGPKVIKILVAVL